MAALREFAGAARLHVCPAREEAALHGRRDRAVERVAARSESRLARPRRAAPLGHAAVDSRLAPILSQRAGGWQFGLLSVTRSARAQSDGWTTDARLAQQRRLSGRSEKQRDERRGAKPWRFIFGCGSLSLSCLGAPQHDRRCPAARRRSP